ncbi:MAG: glycosyltransferase family 2 protein, partial [Planctomycetes bacterium]|nr:glycosyltransferase family 2 protein [Planctomycetota bacterium]
MNQEHQRLPYSISVVIPAYNAEEYVGRAIESVLNQTRPAEEVIVVDDGSLDGTAAVVDDYGSKLRLIVQSNEGVSEARNVGIKAAQSEWIAFLDADDEWLPEKLKVQMAHLRGHSDLVWTHGDYFKSVSREIPLKPARDMNRAEALLGGKEYFNSYFEGFLSGFYAWTGTILVRREVLIKAGLFRKGQLRAQDTDMWFRIAYKWPRIGFISQPLAIFHEQIPKGITKTHRDSKIIGDLLERHFELSGRFDKYEEFLPCGLMLLKDWL